MKLIRLWRQYDSVKAVIMLLALAVFMLGYSIREAIAYAVILRTPTAYICTAPNGFATILPQLAQMECVRGYSLQKTATFIHEDHTLPVTLLSAAYLSDCYGIEDNPRAIYANRTAFSAFFGDTAQQSEQIRGTLDGKPFYTEIIQTDAMPDTQTFSAMAVGAAELHDASELRICLTEPDAAAMEQLGLCIVNPEIQLAADYEQRLVLLRVRFGMLAAILSCIAAAAFFRIYRLH